MKRILSSLKRFFFAPAMPYPLAALRIGLAFMLIVQAVSVVPVYFELYGVNGILQGTIARYLSTGLPETSRATEWLAAVGLNETQSLILLGGVYVASLVGLLLGWHTRLMAFTAWFTHMLFAQGHSTSYGADSFASIFLFYLIWVPSEEALSLDSKGRVPEAKSTTRLGLRLVQIHLAIAYFATGIGKAMSEQWWNGQAIWGSVMLPVYRQSLPVEWLAWAPWIAVVAGWGTLLIEIGYPLFIFLPATRKLWVASVVSLHLGIALLLGLHVFAAIMIVFSVSLFGISAEPGYQWSKRFARDPFLRWRRSVTA